MKFIEFTCATGKYALPAHTMVTEKCDFSGHEELHNKVSLLVVVFCVIVSAANVFTRLRPRQSLDSGRLWRKRPMNKWTFMK